MWCLLRLDLSVIVNQFFCFVPRVQKIFALVEYLRVIFLPTLYWGGLNYSITENSITRRRPEG